MHAPFNPSIPTLISACSLQPLYSYPDQCMLPLTAVFLPWSVHASFNPCIPTLISACLLQPQYTYPNQCMPPSTHVFLPWSVHAPFNPCIPTLISACSLQPLTGYNYQAKYRMQIRLICELSKDRNQALISISTGDLPANISITWKWFDPVNNWKYNTPFNIIY